MNTPGIFAGRFYAAFQDQIKFLSRPFFQFIEVFIFPRFGNFVRRYSLAGVEEVEEEEECQILIFLQFLPHISKMALLVSQAISPARNNTIWSIIMLRVWKHSPIGAFLLIDSLFMWSILILIDFQVEDPGAPSGLKIFV